MILVQVVVLGVVASGSCSQVTQLHDAVILPSGQGLEVDFAGAAHNASLDGLGEVQHELPGLTRKFAAWLVQLQDELGVGVQVDCLAAVWGLRGEPVSGCAFGGGSAVSGAAPGIGTTRACATRVRACITRGGAVTDALEGLGDPVGERNCDHPDNVHCHTANHCVKRITGLAFSRKKKKYYYKTAAEATTATSWFYYLIMHHSLKIRISVCPPRHFSVSYQLLQSSSRYWTPQKWTPQHHHH